MGFKKVSERSATTSASSFLIVMFFAVIPASSTTTRFFRKAFSHFICEGIFEKVSEMKSRKLSSPLFVSNSSSIISSSSPERTRFAFQYQNNHYFINDERRVVSKIQFRPGPEQRSEGPSTS